jgi:hypothetical protein
VFEVLAHVKRDAQQALQGGTIDEKLIIARLEENEELFPRVASPCAVLVKSYPLRKIILGRSNRLDFEQAFVVRLGHVVCKTIASHANSSQGFKFSRDISRLVASTVCVDVHNLSRDKHSR